MDDGTREEFKNLLKGMPSLDDLKTNLTKMASMDKSTLSIGEIKQLYFDNAHWLLHSNEKLEKDVLNKFIFYRVRSKVGLSEDMEATKTFSYPDAKYCTSNGRANLINKPVFYCSQNSLVAIKEAKCEVNENYYLGVWHVNVDKPMKYTKLISFDLVDGHPLKILRNARDRVSSSHYNDGLSKSAEFDYLYEFIANLFINEEYPYYLTSFIANELLYKNSLDCLIYPSFQFETNSINWAFHPDFIDRHFRANRFYEYQIQNLTDNGALLLLKRIGHVRGNRIKWAEPTEDEKITFQKLFGV